MTQPILESEFVSQRKKPMLIVLIIILVVGIVYFGTGAYKLNSMSEKPINPKYLELLKNTDLKVAYSPEGIIKIFALAKTTDLEKLEVKSGTNILSPNGIIIGELEANMMLEEKLFSNVGDTLTDLFGLTVTVTGILSPTETFIDDFHFVDAQSYTAVIGKENTLFVKFKDENTPKLFYLYDNTVPLDVKITLVEGDISLYSKQIINSKQYYPIIIGYAEAEMMREEKLFTNIGDTLDDFFGKDVIIVGIVQKTDTSLDMMHLVEPDFFEEQITGTLV